MPSSHRRQDKSVIRRPLIGSSSVGYRKHRTIISGSSADDRSDSGQNLYERGGSDQMSAVTPVIILPPTYQWWISLFSHGQVSCVSCYLPVIVRHYSDELRWSPDENVFYILIQTKYRRRCECTCCGSSISNALLPLPRNVHYHVMYITAVRAISIIGLHLVAFAAILPFMWKSLWESDVNQWMALQAVKPHRKPGPRMN